MTPAQSSNIWDDLYKITMGQVAFDTYCGSDAHYVFTNRGNTEFPPGFAEQLQRRINILPSIPTTPEELEFLTNLGLPRPFLSPSYIEWLGNYRYDPNEVTILQDGVELKIDIRGPWYRTIRWEVKLMAMIVELYNEMKGHSPKLGWLETAAQKARLLRVNKIRFSDFGTRRAFSGRVHEDVLKKLIDNAGPYLLGTSNLYLAMKHKIKVVGTRAHEWDMAHACMFGLRNATDISLDVWSNEFEGDLGIALTDTFTTEVFLRDFSPLYSKLYDGVRHDSGCPFNFTDKIVRHYDEMGIDPLTKTIVFSDALDVHRAIEINDYCENKIKRVFGIGTHLTNDVGHPSLNIVIKLKSLTVFGEVIQAIKLSDDVGKACGDSKAIEHAKYELGL